MDREEKLGWLMLACLFGAMICACAWFKSESSIAAQVSIDCGEKLVQEEMPNVAATVSTILAGPASDWAMQLDSLGEGLKARLGDIGINAVICVVAQEVQDNSGSKPTQAKTTSQARAGTWMSQRGYRVRAAPVGVVVEKAGAVSQPAPVWPSQLNSSTGNQPAPVGAREE